MYTGDMNILCHFGQALVRPQRQELISCKVPKDSYPPSRVGLNYV